MKTKIPSGGWLLCAALIAPGAQAASATCAGDAGLAAFQGHYAADTLRAALSKTPSWYEARSSIDADRAALTVQDGHVYLNHSWHERDEGDYCVTELPDGLHVRSRAGDEIAGPFHRLARLGENEAHAYLDLIIQGCYAANDHTRWCFSRQGLTIDGKPSDATLQLDLSELPAYGTALRVQAQPPFLILVRRGEQWAVFEDDWASSENYRPVDPEKDQPKWVLTPQP